MITPIYLGYKYEPLEELKNTLLLTTTITLLISIIIALDKSTVCGEVFAFLDCVDTRNTTTMLWVVVLGVTCCDLLHQS